jgi:hypothetical protein
MSGPSTVYSTKGQESRVDEKAAAAPALTAPAPTDPAPSFGGSKNVTNCNNFILFPFIKQF